MVYSNNGFRTKHPSGFPSDFTNDFMRFNEFTTLSIIVIEDNESKLH